MRRPIDSLPRPLYQSASAALADRPPGGHAGLWYDKFCDRWTGRWSDLEVKKPDWIRTVTEHPVGDKASLNDFARRQRNLVEAIKGKSVLLRSESRFVTGLGREHPVENGFAWHPTLGTPYLPGSSIKGLLRTWAGEWWANEKDGEEREDRKAQINAILGYGGLKTEEDRSVGSIILFDALPVDSVKLELDVMTPHYGEYYQEGKPPGDWISPTPIPFLVVAEDTRFQFAFAPRTTAGREHLPTVENWLKNALQWLGAGAKTAVGYGRFGEPQPMRKEQADQQQTSARPSPTPSLPVSSDMVEAILLEEKTRKGGWKAKHVGSGIAGPIQNTGDVPSDAEAGTTLSLIVASAKPTEIAFRYPTDSEKQRAERPKKKSKPKSPRRRKA